MPDGGAAGQACSPATRVQEEASGSHRDVGLRCQGTQSTSSPPSLSVKPSEDWETQVKQTELYTPQTAAALFSFLWSVLEYVCSIYLSRINVQDMHYL